MEPFLIKRGDTLPSLQATLSSGDLVDATVVFVLRKNGSKAAEFRKPAVIVDAGARIVRFDWGTSDTAVAGSYRGEFEVTRSDGKVFTAPTDDYIPITILSDLG